MSTVGQRLQIARIKANLQQKQVIQLLKNRGISLTQTSLSRYERDQREISLNLLRELSLIYKVDVTNIIWSDYELEQMENNNK